MRSKCRIWWPKQLACNEPSSPCNFLFGWFISCTSASIDIVVAFACNEIEISHYSQSSLQEVLRDANGKMPLFLQNKSTFSLLGQCASFLGGNGKLFKVRMEEDVREKSYAHDIHLATNGEETLRQNYGRSSCGCHILNGLVEHCWLDSVESGHWIQLVYDSYEQYGRSICWVPKLHHIHWNKQIVSYSDVHVIIYEIPMYGVHHFSLNFGDTSEQVEASHSKPKWVDELSKNHPLFDLDTVTLAINCVNAAKVFLERHMGSNTSFASSSIICMCLVFMWQVLAISVASICTLFYIVLQLFLRFSSSKSKTWLYIMLGRVFRTTWKTIQIRCCQILYWPILLQDNGHRVQSCVEYSEKAALRRHSMWSSLAVDLLFGNLIGLMLLFHADSICLWVVTFANDVTNGLLRSGCVWLMGVPAGFKLNMELAGVLGMASLNAIQIWSTLWIFTGFLFIYFIKGLALLGILFGVSIPAALVIDMVVLATLHVSTLHWAFSLLYSQQIQALAALWRLFRGRKWNPLRQRLDSYDYIVKQHIVGALLFTPLLLLLPTTSVFYMFFTILNTAIALICVLIEVTISLVHCTPYIKVFLWLVGWRRFPSGIWFEFLFCQTDFPEFVKSAESSEQKKDKEQKRYRSSILVSILHSNFLSIGEVVLPHYQKVFSRISDFVKTSAYGALTGNRTATTLGIGFPSTMPWMCIQATDYWCLCHNSILQCMAERDCHV